ncbi:MAG: hypothetical protein JXA69_17825 [Phycisphaerae bacterium]|nr:hypothetical protein [Phycisphaerae bacterium]
MAHRDPMTAVSGHTISPFVRRPAHPFRTLLSRVLMVAVTAAVFGLILEYGFHESPLPHDVLVAIEVFAIAVFVLERFSRLIPLSGAAAQLRRNGLDYLLIVAGAVVVAAEWQLYRQPVRRVGTVYLITLQAALVARFAIGLFQLQISVAKQRLQPGKFMVGSFLAVILIGGLLLSLPTATKPIVAGEKPHQWRDHVINCVFTATSATCITGLAVYDTGNDFTFRGQVIILILIQLGGLGIMIFGTVVGLLIGRQMSLHESLVMQDMLSHQTLGHLSRMVKFVCLVTFAAEAVGAAMLYPMWNEADVANGGRVFWSVFHSISAFCNAGFSLSPTSLVPYRGCWQVYGAIMPLIVLGGLGFPVLHELWTRTTAGLRWRLHRRFAAWFGHAVPSRPRRSTYSLHTRLVVTTSVLLIIGGAVLLWFAETPTRWNKQHRTRMNDVVEVKATPDCMSAMPADERLAAAVFQSITARTAGFNTVPMDERSISPASHFLLCLLMFIGGSPASTAGGIKTVALAVLFVAVRSTLRGRPGPEAFRRSIAQPIVARVAVITVLMFAMVSLVTVLLCYFENASLRQLVFETISASGTVGLSTGITPSLTRAGRLLIILAMFAGRIGPLTLLVALARRQRSVRYDYPEEQPIIG